MTMGWFFFCFLLMIWLELLKNKNRLKFGEDGINVLVILLQVKYLIDEKNSAWIWSKFYGNNFLYWGTKFLFFIFEYFTLGTVFLKP